MKFADDAAVVGSSPLRFLPFGSRATGRDFRVVSPQSDNDLSLSLTLFHSQHPSYQLAVFEFSCFFFCNVDCFIRFTFFVFFWIFTLFLLACLVLPNEMNFL